ncbi:branched-chain amino acid ABC transporter permease [Microbacterium sp. BWT-B31]|uniref:branched-chain amino acid ABC transporter permease n=1 Tax=Microbacterium sp. BWT-B31 TaxID=3232072 RepID=UPI0035272C85
MEHFLQLVVEGIISGSIYGAMALSIVMVYRASKLLNFAQGEMATLSAFLVYQGQVFGLPVWLSILLSLVITALLGVTVERLLVRPLGAMRSHLPVIIVTLGLMTVMTSVNGAIWGWDARPLNRMFGVGSFDVGGVSISYQGAGLVITIGLMALTLGVVFRFTRLGLGLRATAENPESARLSGVRVGTMLSVGWALGAVIGGVAGILVGPILTLEPNLMVTVLLYAFAAAILGGMDSPVGAIVGGIIVGVIENLAGSYLPWIGYDFKQVVALVVIIVVLAMRPQGLFGRKELTRV